MLLYFKMSFSHDFLKNRPGHAAPATALLAIGCTSPADALSTIGCGHVHVFFIPMLP
jgi:hypothetical protein